ncbi:MAG TPA: hypothetical protein P5121_25940, partial [Caldilineaceae bacterium]|nr:hypothetical protein [Caldilineaceae bacterium]
MSQKKLLIALVAILALFLAACGGGSSTAPESANEAAPTTAPAAEEATAEEAAPAAEAPSETAALAPGELPEVNPLEVSGDIISAG